MLWINLFHTKRQYFTSFSLIFSPNIWSQVESPTILSLSHGKRASSGSSHLGGDQCSPRQKARDQSLAKGDGPVPHSSARDQSLPYPALTAPTAYVWCKPFYTGNLQPSQLPPTPPSIPSPPAFGSNTGRLRRKIIFCFFSDWIVLSLVWFGWQQQSAVLRLRKSMKSWCKGSLCTEKPQYQGDFPSHWQKHPKQFQPFLAI